MDDAAAKAKAPNLLFEQLKTQLAEGSAKFRLLLQLASPGDKTGDSTVVSLAFDPWALDRRNRIG
jgi:hypothetical protein